MGITEIKRKKDFPLIVLICLTELATSREQLDRSSENRITVRNANLLFLM